MEFRQKIHWTSGNQIFYYNDTILTPVKRGAPSELFVSLLNGLCLLDEGELVSMLEGQSKRNEFIETIYYGMEWFALVVVLDLLSTVSNCNDVRTSSAVAVRCST